MDYTATIKGDIMKKIICNDPWSNEFGSCCNQNSMWLTKYTKESDFKVNYKEDNDFIYFKIVPSYFSIPNAHYYWNSYDGFVKNKKIYWVS